MGFDRSAGEFETRDGEWHFGFSLISDPRLQRALFGLPKRFEHAFRTGSLPETFAGKPEDSEYCARSWTWRTRSGLPGRESSGEKIYFAARAGSAGAVGARRHQNDDNAPQRYLCGEGSTGGIGAQSEGRFVREPAL